MLVKTVLGFVFKADQDLAVLDALDSLSARFDAHPVCVLGCEVPVAVFVGMDGYVNVLSGDLVQYLEDALKQEEARVREALRRRGGAEFAALESVSGDFERLAAVRSRYADLIVVRRPEKSDQATREDLIDAVLMNSGRPVLVVPPQWKVGPIGSKVVVAWDGSREASRALSDAQILFAPQADVTVVTVDDDDGTLGDDIATSLARHGLAVTARNEKSGGVGAADVLMDVVRNVGADLLVMGGYRHSRMQQTLFGGVTRSILGKSGVPVLISH
jgi:nucleotide-binding universal stress UspA family protein